MDGISIYAVVWPLKTATAGNTTLTLVLHDRKRLMKSMTYSDVNVR